MAADQPTFAKGAASRLLNPSPADPVIAILKLVGQACNIDCSYCYERRKPDGAGALTPAELDDFLQRLDGRTVHCILHGGEPLLIGKRRMVELLDILSAADNVESVAIQTNGIRLDSEWLDLFERHCQDLTWGVSFDGLGALTKYRIDYRGNSAGEATYRGMELLGRAGVRFGMLCVVTSAHIGGAVEFMRSIADLEGLASVKLSPCYDQAVQTRPRRTKSGQLMTLYANEGLSKANGEGVATAPGWTISPAEYARFVDEAQREWITSSLWRRFALEPTVSVANNLKGLLATYTDYSDTKDGQLLTLYPGGVVAGHDRGHEFTLAEATSSGVQQFLADQLAHTNAEWQPFLDECAVCPAWEGCRGGELFMRKMMRDAGLSEEFCDARRNIVASVHDLLGEG